MPDFTPRTSYGLSPSQTRKLLGNALFGAERVQNVEQVICTSTERLDLAVFTQAWRTIFDRHSALRVGFGRDEEQQPYQEIHSSIELPIVIEDRRELKASEREAFVEEWRALDRQKIFDLSVPPLMRVTVLRFADDSVTWVWTFHHILMDGRSFVLVLDDFFACYEALCAGNAVTLPERKHFSAFIAWYESWLASRQNSAGSYWQQLFLNDDTDSVLSITRTTTVLEGRQETLRLKIKPETNERLQRLVRDFELTGNTVVQGVWALLLSRYYRSQSVTFTVARSCRRGSIDGTEEMIGSLMNFLPAHVRISGGIPVVDFLQDIRRQQLAVRDFQWTPWDVVRNSIPVAASKQLFDTCVAYERYDLDDEMSNRFGKNGTRKFSLRAKSGVPLLLSVTENPQLQFDLSYRVDLFEEADVRQLSRSFLALLDQILAAPTALVETLQLMDAGDKAAVIAKLSGPESIVPEDKGLHHWFEAQVRKTPHELAVVAERSLTYEQLDREASALAERLMAAGGAPDKLVAIFLPRSAMSLVAILGILKSGAAYLPIDVTIPKTRISDLMGDANAIGLVTDQNHAASLPALSTPVFILEGGTHEAPCAPARATPGVRGSQLAYVIPTSGTTGRPKLTGVEHRQASNLLAYATQHLIKPEDFRWVPFIDSPSFDSSISQIFITLALGGTLVLVEDILYIGTSAYYEKFTCLGTTPSLLSFILEQLGLPPAVRLIGLGAEAIPAALLEKLGTLPQVSKVINYYGPTEATVYCTVAIPLDRDKPDQQLDLRDRGRVIGRPIANTRIYLVDEVGQLVPPGAPGEIYIAGASVARGYLNHAGKASENFMPDRFSEKAGERMYRSGDIACLKVDGQLEFHGRKDHQLKFNGVRIEAAEIENALLKFPGVRQSVVDVRSDGDGKKRLVAYLKAGGETISKQQLRKVLRLLLPGAMIPQHFVVLSDLPLTSNGKVDRDALSRIDLGLEPFISPGTPATPAEIQMKSLWEQNLSRNSIGLDQDYFELGGDSLSAVNLLLAIEKEFGIRLKPQVLLESSTISDLVREIQSHREVAASPRQLASDQLLSLQASGSRTPLILIPGESGEAVLSYKKFAENFFPDHPVYALQAPYALMIDAPADPMAVLSTHFARQIVDFAKDRPFVLFGHCVGGLLAWHVASALQNENVPPFRLVLYDAPVPQKGGNVEASWRESAAQPRLQKFSKAYRLAWSDWKARYGSNWRTKARFLFWAVKNVFMRKGLDPSESGRDNFAKLAYLRALQGCPLSIFSSDALLIYHHSQAEAVSKSLWHAHSTGKIQFEFVPGDHSIWESAIHNTIPLIRHEIDLLDGREEPTSGAFSFQSGAD